jgi:hypothetical protein
VPAGKYPAQIETGEGVCELELQVPDKTGQVDLGQLACKAHPKLAEQR